MDCSPLTCFQLKETVYELSLQHRPCICGWHSSVVLINTMAWLLARHKSFLACLAIPSRGAFYPASLITLTVPVPAVWSRASGPATLVAEEAPL